MRGTALHAAGGVVLSMATTVGTQDARPGKPIKLVCATSAGSGAEFWCLLVSEILGEQLGMQIEALFKHAGAGIEAATYVSENEPDVYTWLLPNTSYCDCMNLSAFRPDPQNFIGPVEVEKLLYAISVDPDAPYETYEDRTTDMRESDQPIAVAGNKSASAHHLYLVKVFKAAGPPCSYVSFDGSGGAMRDTLDGHVDVAIGPPGIWQPHAGSGAARYLFLINEGTTDWKGLSELPIPAEFGMEYKMIHQIRGVIAVEGTPTKMADRIGDDRVGSLQGKSGAEPAHVTGAQHGYRREQAAVPAPSRRDADSSAGGRSYPIASGRGARRLPTPRANWSRPLTGAFS